MKYTCKNIHIPWTISHFTTTNQQKVMNNCDVEIHHLLWLVSDNQSEPGGVF